MTTITGLTPYITPQVLLNAPTGISWSTIPSLEASPAAQWGEQYNICARATSMVDAATNNILRSTIDQERMYVPDFRGTVNRYTQVARVELSRFPVTQVLGGQVSNAAQFPPQWQPIPATAFMVEKPPIGLYGTSVPSSSAYGGQAVMIAPGYVSWFNGRQGYVLEVTYVNGWPHTSLTAGATAGAMAIQVDDCTGWAPVQAGQAGARGVVFDATNQETVSCTGASAQSGPGILTLSAPLSYTHAQGVMISTLPSQIIEAAILYATAEALIRGATATAINVLGGGEPGGGSDHFTLQSLAKELCSAYRRVI